MTINGVDLASYQGAPDFGRMKTAGIGFAVTKVTEDTTYSFPGAKRNRSESARVGIVAGMYHFARATDPTKEADYFLSAVGRIGTGEFLCLDWEVSTDSPVPWCLVWLTRVWKRTGLRPFIYLNGSTVAAHDWGPIARANFPLWLAKYDGSPNMVNVPHWGMPSMKQYSDAGTIPGINGKVDLDIFYGTASELRSYGGRPASVPSPPAPTPASVPALQYGETSPAVESLQSWLNGYPWKPPLPLLPVTGFYGDQTTAVVVAAQRQCGITDGDGRNIGPKTRAAFYARGWRV